MAWNPGEQPGPTPVPPPRRVPRHAILHSWKEVAQHLGVTERSVQRWNKSSGLPVHREGSGRKARIVAYTDELDLWLESAGQERREQRPPSAVSRWKRRAVIALPVCAALLLGLWWWATLPGARRYWKLEGSKLTILDARERVCWVKRFPTLNKDFNPEKQDAVTVADIDGDGRPEVLFILYPHDFEQNPGALWCFDARGRERWQFRFGGTKTFAARTFERHFKGQFVRPVTIGGKARLLAVANHALWYPSQVALLDAATGALLEEYWHPGLISHCEVQDIDGDGAPEFIFGAINNPGQGLGHAGAGILNLPFSRPGPHLVAADARFPPVMSGGERVYALFPMADVSRALAVWPGIVEFRVTPERLIILETRLAEGGGVVYYLDHELKPVEWRVSDNFTPLHRRLQLQGLLDHPLSDEETAALGKVLRFASAPDGNHPTLAELWRDGR